MTKLLNRFFKDESGATAIEYGLIAALISIVIVGAAGLAGGSLQGIFTTISTELGTANGGGGNN